MHVIQNYSRSLKPSIGPCSNGRRHPSSCRCKKNANKRRKVSVQHYSPSRPAGSENTFPPRSGHQGPMGVASTSESCSEVVKPSVQSGKSGQHLPQQKKQPYSAIQPLLFGGLADGTPIPYFCLESLGLWLAWEAPNKLVGSEANPRWIDWIIV